MFVPNQILFDSVRKKILFYENEAPESMVLIYYPTSYISYNGLPSFTEESMTKFNVRLK